ncbi:hypothetical protein F66182_6437 [Fusarium sp. NRRL 66182]|nr:hypothetical protein F66182_6437 [Fusarium sp. NRRL 66182]
MPFQNLQPATACRHQYCPPSDSFQWERVSDSVGRDKLNEMYAEQKKRDDESPDIAQWDLMGLKNGQATPLTLTKLSEADYGTINRWCEDQCFAYFLHDFVRVAETWAEHTVMERIDEWVQRSWVMAIEAAQGGDVGMCHVRMSSEEVEQYRLMGERSTAAKEASARERLKFHGHAEDVERMDKARLRLHRGPIFEGDDLVAF